MSLPKKTRPEYSTTLSNGKKVKFHPFTVKEEKILVLAAETQDIDEVTNAIANTLNNCITSPADVTAETLSLFDLQLLFLKCRAKSVGEKVKVKITDPNDETYTVEHEINIDKIQLEKTEGHSDLITLDETTSVKMKYPGLEFFAEGLSLDGVVDTTKSIKECIGQIIVGEEVYNRADMTDDELETWVDDLTAEEVAKLVGFFTTMPTLKHKITLKNPNTKENFSVTLEGVQDFF